MKSITARCQRRGNHIFCKFIWGSDNSSSIKMVTGKYTYQHSNADLMSTFLADKDLDRVCDYARQYESYHLGVDLSFICLDNDIKKLERYEYLETEVSA